jgi:hypothetical protein
LQRREQDAATKVTTAQRGFSWFLQANVTELVKAREPDDVAINTRIIDAATEFIEAVATKNNFEREIAKLIAPARGLDPVNEIKNTDRLGQLRVELKRLVGDGIPSSLPMSICPPEGTLPPQVQTSGGWVSRAHAEVTEEHRRRREQEQDERERQARRRVTISPPQPAPSAHTERELFRRGWEAQ